MTVTTLDQKPALVVIDLQRGITGAPGAPLPMADVLARNVELAAAFRAAGLPVVLVRVSFSPDGGDVMPGRTEQARPGGAPAPGWDIVVDELADAAGENAVVVTKRNWSALYGTDLDVQLRRRGVTQIVLTGVATSIGVESTARDAYASGYHVVPVVDAMTDLDADAHDNSIRRIFPRLGETATTDEVLKLLAARS